jgi:hypothetical protein
VCCREKTLAQAGSLELGDRCEDSSECESGNCNNTYINNVGDIVYLGANYLVCVPPTTEQEQDRVQQSQNAALLGTAGAVAAAAMVTAPIVVTSLPALTPLGAYSYATAAITTAPAWVQTGVTVAGVTAGWAGVGAGTLACVTDPNSNACMAYTASLMADPTGLTSLANATDDLFNAGVQTVNTALNQQVDDIFDGLDTLGYGYQDNSYEYETINLVHYAKNLDSYNSIQENGLLSVTGRETLALDRSPLDMTLAELYGADLRTVFQVPANMVGVPDLALGGSQQFGYAIYNPVQVNLSNSELINKMLNTPIKYDPMTGVPIFTAKDFGLTISEIPAEMIIP